jgi:hypothetical protein
MPLAESRNAIGALAEHLAIELTNRTDANTVDIGRPDQAATSGAKLNIFLYQIDFDGFMRNIPLDAGQEPPLWLNLHYLLTAFDESGESDSVEAQHLLGQGLLALQAISMQRPSAPPLADNPEPIKISFDSADSELLSNIMQGSDDDEKYRISAAFQARPILLASLAAISSGPLIRSIGPPATPGIVVLPSMGPRLDTVDPGSFEMGDSIVLRGGDLAADSVEVCFGDVCLPVPAVDVASNQIDVTVPAPPTADLSAGTYAISLVKLLPSGRRFSSNAALGRLRPTVTSASHGPLTPDGGGLFGDLNIVGDRLGGPDDSIFIGFYRNGRVEHLFETRGTAAQTSLTLSLTAAQAIPSATYRIVLRVNGEQALNSPQVSWS